MCCYTCSVLSFIVLFCFGLSCLDLSFVLVSPVPFRLILNRPSSYCSVLSCPVLSSHALSCPLSCLLLSCPVLPCLTSWFVLSFLVLFSFDHILNCPCSCCSVLSCPLSGFVLYCPDLFYLLSSVLFLCLVFGHVLDLSSLVLFFSVASYLVLICPVLVPKQNKTPQAVTRDG